MSSECSFRITRTAEDLAQTITALSQRLVKLEQRFESLEPELNQKREISSVIEIERLNGVDQLLRECQELLDSSSQSNQEITSTSEEESDLIAA